MIKDWPSFEGLNCTINTTEDCNLRCKYCYETHKRPRDIDINVAYKFIDLIIDSIDKKENFLNIDDENDFWIYDGLIFDFIGGDSLINPELLDKLLTRINTKVSNMKNPLKRGWRASISSNGTLFERQDVRDFCEKWSDSLSLGVSIDGCPEIHDMNRVFVNGEGTMSTIVKWIPWFRKVFPIESISTKATCSKDSIPYLYDSLKFMHEELKLTYIRQNFIMEDTGCTEKDYELLDKQMELCTDYVLKHRNELYWAILDHNHSRDFSKFCTDGKCGSGRMPCCDIEGNIYPCFRWLPHTQNGKSGIMCVGNVNEGFTHPENFTAVQKGSIRANCTKDKKCWDCEFEDDCSYCIGGCYAEHGDFIRTTHICEITKILCKWSKYYENEYKKLENVTVAPWR